jgi:2-keto-4-pentenoate hydratase/2-oxohepta-3-ene-1,7-dioic acid hydratase in catechol pathway
MKLARFGVAGREIPAIVLDDGAVLDARPVTADYDPDFYGTDGIARLRDAVDGGQLPPLDATGLRVGPPIRRPGKIVCIGLNYRNHAIESGMEIPAEPIVFMKAPNTVVGPNDDIHIPRRSSKTDWEVELAVVINATATYLDSPLDALSCVAGYAVSNDVSEREFQLERGGQWDKGKSCATFNPLGPWIVTPDEVGDPQELGLFLDVNDQRLQTGNTSDMIFPVAHLIWYLSQFMVLEPGDVINTGTPAGVGHGLRPPRYLRPGDHILLGIDRLGTQRSQTVSAP